MGWRSEWLEAFTEVACQEVAEELPSDVAYVSQDGGREGELKFGYDEE